SLLRQHECCRRTGSRSDLTNGGGGRLSANNRHAIPVTNKRGHGGATASGRIASSLLAKSCLKESSFQTTIPYN
ncbi:MAG: hypothetical protein LC776_06190, partial [Acidobacteria bacterium]|nr:hypothetical protein [Acidobacteriota bacterium]